MRQRVKPFTRWGGNTLSASMSGTGVVGAADPPSWSLPETINVAQSSFVGIRQYAVNADGATLSVTGLASGLTYNSELERIEAAADAAGTGTATFTINGSISDTATVTAIAADSWLLPSGHWENFMPLEVIYPQPDSEGVSSYARHRWAHTGMDYEIPIGVSRGAWPYRYELLSGPTGAAMDAETMQWVGDHMEIPEGYGVVRWPAASVAAAGAGPHAFVVRVHDQAGNSVDVEWAVTVDNSKFVFIDYNTGNDTTGTGSISAPLKNPARTEQDTSFAGTIGVIRQTPLLNLADTSLFEGGAEFTATAVNTVFPNGVDYPTAWINFPGETVHINAKNRLRMALVGAPDRFWAGIVCGFVSQGIEPTLTLNDVKVFAHNGISKRPAYWRMQCIRPWLGRTRNDNAGFIMFSHSGGNANDYTGHDRTYVADCVIRESNRDPSDEALMGGWGGNSGALLNLYTSSRVLAERNSVFDSRSTGLAFIHCKGIGDTIEFRANDTANGNTGEFHVKNLTLTLDEPSRGTSRRMHFCYNRCGGLLGSPVFSVNGTVALSHVSSTRDPAHGGEWFMFRNTYSGNSRNHSNVNEGSIPPISKNNILGSESSDYNNQGNVTMPTTEIRESTVDGNMKLIGSARTLYLGTKGAEIA